MVLHFPGPVERDPKVGSGSQVTRMLEAFRELGFEVEIVAGTSRERRDAMRRVLADARSGRRFELVYSKASTIPTALTDPKHIPLRPLLDARFFRRMRRHGARVGLFYPDVYWRHPETWQRKRWRRVVYGALHRFDLWWYRHTVDLLFLPSMAMAKWIPGWQTSPRLRVLNPGGRPLEDGDLAAERRREALRVFYVGGVVAPLYDVEPLVRAVRSVAGVELTICCPSGTGDHLAGPGVTVAHGSGEIVTAGYLAADVAAMVFAPVPYRDFAMPIKLFEAVGAGRPIIATADTAAGEFVAAHGIGWSVPNSGLEELLRRLAADRAEVDRVRSAVIAQRSFHTWAVRAQYLVGELGALPPVRRPR